MAVSAGAEMHTFTILGVSLRPSLGQQVRKDACGVCVHVDAASGVNNRIWSLILDDLNTQKHFLL